jgi:hypothetical protein
MASAIMQRGVMPEERALLAGLCVDSTGRGYVEDAFDLHANIDGPLPAMVDEIVIGGGAHAAVYAAVRKRQGYPPPLVLDDAERFGGTFAMTRNSSFFLNSRNHPGPLGAPGSPDALNVIPGALMQPSDLGGFEYQANADLGLVVRCTLALNAVVRRAKVTEVTRNGNQIAVVTERGLVRAKRVIVATGIGRRRVMKGYPADGKRVLTYEQFMARFDDRIFPLQELGRVAVFGGGDSGKTVVEGLTGYGPMMGGSVASLDYVQRIDWYGIEQGMTKERWLECNRTRYKPLAALFPKLRNTEDTRNARVRGVERLQVIYPSYDGVVANGESYDTAIDCRGFSTKTGWREMIGADPAFELTTKFSNPDEDRGTSLALASLDSRLYVVGPAAKLEYTAFGETSAQTNENRVALFRLAPRTAALAVRLGNPA